MRAMPRLPQPSPLRCHSVLIACGEGRLRPGGGGHVVDMFFRVVKDNFGGVLVAMGTLVGFGFLVGVLTTPAPSLPIHAAPSRTDREGARPMVRYRTIRLSRGAEEGRTRSYLLRAVDVRPLDRLGHPGKVGYHRCTTASIQGQSFGSTRPVVPQNSGQSGETLGFPRSTKISGHITHLRCCFAVSAKAKLLAWRSSPLPGGFVMARPSIRLAIDEVLSGTP